MKTPREIAEAGTEAWNVHDIAAFAAGYASDAVVVTPDAGVLKGHDQLVPYFEGFLEAFPDATIEVTGRHDTADGTVDEWIFHGTHTGPLELPNGETIGATGKRVSVRGVGIDTYEDEQVVEQHTYFDRLELLEQLELVPSP